jgi:hypothetical protein
VVIAGFRGIDPRNSYAYSHITRGSTPEDAHEHTLAELERQHPKLADGRYILPNDEIFMPLGWHYIVFPEDLSEMYEDLERLKIAEKALRGELADPKEGKRSVIRPIPKREDKDEPETPDAGDGKEKK